MRFLLSTTILVLMSTPLQANINFNGVTAGLSLYYSQDHESTSVKGTTGSTKADDAGQLYHLNLGIGYTLNNGVYLGAKYLARNNTVEGDSTLVVSGAEVKFNNSTVTDESGYGASVGYLFKGGLHIIATYLVGYDYKHTTESKVAITGAKSSVTNTSDGGSGLLVEIGYLFKAGNSLGFGPQLMYLSTTYDKLTTETEDFDGTTTKSETEGTWDRTRILPLLAVMMSF